MPTPAGICPIKQRLANELYQAVTALTGLQSDQAKAVMTGADGARFDSPIEDARMKWENARELYRAHLREHRC